MFTQSNPKIVGIIDGDDEQIVSLSMEDGILTIDFDKECDSITLCMKFSEVQMALADIQRHNLSVAQNKASNP